MSLTNPFDPNQPSLAETAEEEMTSPLPGQVLMYVSRFDSDYNEDGSDGRVIVPEVRDAHVITSMVDGKPGVHKPVLDIDLPAQLIPSSTPGHFHLLIDHEIEQGKYQELLDLMAEVGLIEPGYAKAAERRGHTAVRLPWIRKDDPAAEAADAFDPI